MRHALRRAGAAMVHGGMRRSFLQWQQAVESIERGLLRLARAFHPEVRGKSRAFRSMIVYSEHRRAQRATAAGFRDSLRLRAFNTWASALEDESRKASLVKRAGAALVSNGRRRAYTTLQEVAGELAWRLRLLHRVAAALANRRLRRRSKPPAPPPGGRPPNYPRPPCHAAAGTGGRGRNGPPPAPLKDRGNSHPWPFFRGAASCSGRRFSQSADQDRWPSPRQ